MTMLNVSKENKLDAETRVFLLEKESEIKALMYRAVGDIIQIGQKLIEVKGLVGHGNYEKWIKESFGWSIRTARNYVRVAKTISLEDIDGIELPARALYLISAKSTPNDVRQEVLVWARSNQVTSFHEIKDRVIKSKSAHSAKRRSVHFSSKSSEHYTPPHIIEAVLACMGRIDLDPCSNEGEPNVPAKRHFTMVDDGLNQVWRGRVYMNPPYGREIGKWVEKLCDEYENGQVVEAIALVPARVDTQWWIRMRDRLICFVEGRLTFGGNDDPAPFPSALVYFGQDIGQFFWAFDELGDIWQRIEPGMFGE